MSFDLLHRRAEKFVLWLPGASAGSTPPQLILGIIDDNTAATFTQVFQGPFVSADKPDLWEIDPSAIQPPLQDGTVYSYWFLIQDTSPENLGSMRITDPIAHTVDYRVSFTVDRELIQLHDGVTTDRDDKAQPASVIKFRANKLWPCDIDGNEPSQVKVPTQDAIPDNNHIVIYELPVSWARYAEIGGVQVDIGTFTDVLALFDVATAGDRFKSITSIANEAIVSDLGINVLELLPAADARPEGQWGYATANYFATDFDLGTASELVNLVETVHSKNIRLFTDVVMAFGHDPYIFAAFQQFHISPPDEPNNPDSYQSHTNGQLRDGYGGRPWRYIQNTNHTYDPESGRTSTIHPSWSFHKGHLRRWMSDFGVSGLRLDSVNNIASYDFIRAYKEYAWLLYRSRYTKSSDNKFLVIGEELSDPLDLITTGCLNSLWNEPFQGRLRATILGGTVGRDNFEWTVRKMINCTLDTDHPFTDGSQAVNYITSHDTEGYRKERLYNFLTNNGITDIERRAKLAFACFLTAVGIPMIFAGEEFCDQMDRPISQKQIDPVNYERKAEPWRSAVFDYVAGLVYLRKNCPALGVDDTDFLHVDDSRGGKIMAWKRGAPGQAPVIVVANFTYYDTPGAQYVVPNWLEVDRSDWREVTQNQDVPQDWVGKEPLVHWEVKIYTYWRGDQHI